MLTEFEIASVATRFDTVSKRELNQQTAEVLSRVTSDNPVVVTERGEPRWKVIEFDSGELHLTGLKRLEVLGLVTPAIKPKFKRTRQPSGNWLTRSPEERDAILADMKGDY